MEIKVSLGEKKSVTAYFNGFEVLTDQPQVYGGGGLAPAPFDLFLASIATCAGFFVQRFCATRGISTEGISLLQKSEADEKTHLISKIQIEIFLPEGFPEKYKSSVIAAANQCTVKKHLLAPPEIDVKLVG